MKRNYELTADFQFKYFFSDFDPITTNNFFDAVDQTCKDIYNEALSQNLNKIGLCLSGLDSELIAFYLEKNSIPVEYFFLLITGINDKDLEICKIIANKNKKHLNVVSLTIDEFIDTNIYENFEITYNCWPTYAVIPSLIKKIPDNYYIILGEGDLEKTNLVRYEKIFNAKVKNYDDSNFYVPMQLSEIAYRKSLNFFKKIGESNFFSRNYNLWYHILRDANLVTNKRYYYDPKTYILKKFAVESNFKFLEKTLNFDDKQYRHKQKIITNLCNYAKKYPLWNPYIGDMVIISDKLI